MAKPTSLSWVIVKRRYALVNFSFEKERPADTTVTGTVSKIRKATAKLEIASCKWHTNVIQKVVNLTPSVIMSNKVWSSSTLHHQCLCNNRPLTRREPTLLSFHVLRDDNNCSTVWHVTRATRQLQPYWKETHVFWRNYSSYLNFLLGTLFYFQL